MSGGALPRLRAERRAVSAHANPGFSRWDWLRLESWLAVFVLRPQLVFAITSLFGGIIAAGGVARLALPGASKWAWIPLVIDWGGLPMLLGAWLTERQK